MDKTLLEKTPLGKITAYVSQYNPSFLCPISRAAGRKELKISAIPPFSGVDVWTSYEFSWLNVRGKPQTAMVEFWVPDNSANIIESKSFKLYLNSFSQTSVINNEELIKTLKDDLSAAAGGEIVVKLILPEKFSQIKRTDFKGVNLDNLDIATQEYQLNPDFLAIEANEKIFETIYSHNFAAICPVTGQPDWASVLIRYEGKKINHEGLLRYLISYRKHNDFHEHCTEQMFMDIMKRCAPEKLTVATWFARRGGLDINPFRSNFETCLENIRTFRQ